MSRQVNIAIDDLVYTRLTELARAAKMPVSTYAKVLFEAAYAARWGKSGDVELDAKVGCALLLQAAKQNSADIARALGLQESTVVRIIDAYRAERAAA